MAQMTRFCSHALVTLGAIALLVSSQESWDVDWNSMSEGSGVVRRKGTSSENQVPAFLRIDGSTFCGNGPVNIAHCNIANVFGVINNADRVYTTSSIFPFFSSMMLYIGGEARQKSHLPADTDIPSLALVAAAREVSTSLGIAKWACYDNKKKTWSDLLAGGGIFPLDQLPPPAACPGTGREQLHLAMSASLWRLYAAVLKRVGVRTNAKRRAAAVPLNTAQFAMTASLRGKLDGVIESTLWSNYAATSNVIAAQLKAALDAVTYVDSSSARRWSRRTGSAFSLADDLLLLQERLRARPLKERCAVLAENSDFDLPECKALRAAVTSSATDAASGVDTTCARITEAIGQNEPVALRTALRVFFTTTCNKANGCRSVATIIAVGLLGRAHSSFTSVDRGDKSHTETKANELADIMRAAVKLYDTEGTERPEYRRRVLELVITRVLGGKKIKLVDEDELYSVRDEVWEQLASTMDVGVAWSIMTELRLAFKPYFDILDFNPFPSSYYVGKRRKDGIAAKVKVGDLKYPPGMAPQNSPRRAGSFTPPHISAKYLFASEECAQLQSLLYVAKETNVVTIVLMDEDWCDATDRNAGCIDVKGIDLDLGVTRGVTKRLSTVKALEALRLSTFGESVVDTEERTRQMGVVNGKLSVRPMVAMASAQPEAVWSVRTRPGLDSTVTDAYANKPGVSVSFRSIDERDKFATYVSENMEGYSTLDAYLHSPNYGVDGFMCRQKVSGAPTVMKTGLYICMNIGAGGHSGSSCMPILLHEGDDDIWNYNQFENHFDVNFHIEEMCYNPMVVQREGKPIFLRFCGPFTPDAKFANKQMGICAATSEFPHGYCHTSRTTNGVFVKTRESGTEDFLPCDGVRHRKEHAALAAVSELIASMPILAHNLKAQLFIVGADENVDTIIKLLGEINSAVNGQQPRRGSTAALVQLNKEVNQQLFDVVGALHILLYGKKGWAQIKKKGLHDKSSGLRLFVKGKGSGTSPGNERCLHRGFRSSADVDTKYGNGIATGITGNAPLKLAREHADAMLCSLIAMIPTDQITLTKGKGGEVFDVDGVEFYMTSNWASNVQTYKAKLSGVMDLATKLQSAVVVLRAHSFKGAEGTKQTGVRLLPVANGGITARARELQRGCAKDLKALCEDHNVCTAQKSFSDMGAVAGQLKRAHAIIPDDATQSLTAHALILTATKCAELGAIVGTIAAGVGAAPLSPDSLKMLMFFARDESRTLAAAKAGEFPKRLAHINRGNEKGPTFFSRMTDRELRGVIHQITLPKTSFYYPAVFHAAELRGKQSIMYAFIRLIYKFDASGVKGVNTLPDGKTALFPFWQKEVMEKCKLKFGDMSFWGSSKDQKIVWWNDAIPEKFMACAIPLATPYLPLVEQTLLHKLVAQYTFVSESLQFGGREGLLHFGYEPDQCDDWYSDLSISAQGFAESAKMLFPGRRCGLPAAREAGRHCPFTTPSLHQLLVHVLDIFHASGCKYGHWSDEAVENMHKLIKLITQRISMKGGGMDPQRQVMSRSWSRAAHRMCIAGGGGGLVKQMRKLGDKHNSLIPTSRAKRKSAELWNEWMVACTKEGRVSYDLVRRNTDASARSPDEDGWMKKAHKKKKSCRAVHDAVTKYRPPTTSEHGNLVFPHCNDEFTDCWVSIAILAEAKGDVAAEQIGAEGATIDRDGTVSGGSLAADTRIHSAKTVTSTLDPSDNDFQRVAQMMTAAAAPVGGSVGGGGGGSSGNPDADPVVESCAAATGSGALGE